MESIQVSDFFLGLANFLSQDSYERAVANMPPTTAHQPDRIVTHYNHNNYFDVFNSPTSIEFQQPIRSPTRALGQMYGGEDGSPKEELMEYVALVMKYYYYETTVLSGRCAVIGGIFTTAPSQLSYERKLASPRKKSETYMDSI